MTTERVGGHALHLGDCLEVMPTLADGSAHMVLADLPYGTTYAPWDSPLPLDRLWEQYRRLIAGPGALVFTSNQPFTTTLVASNLPWYSHEWVWDKENAGNFANARRQPLKQHENVIAFSRGQPPYFPIRTPGRRNHVQGKNAKQNVSEVRLIHDRVADDPSGMKYPKSILYFPKHSSQCGFHPAQKPVELLVYLIRTYTRPGETVLDNTMGSGSTGVACVVTGRKFIGIENDPAHFATACRRVGEARPEVEPVAA